jgi:hypothetical protein
VIASAGNLDGAELRQVRRHELGVEEAKAAAPQMRH